MSDAAILELLLILGVLKLAQVAVAVVEDGRVNVGWRRAGVVDAIAGPGGIHLRSLA